MESRVRYRLTLYLTPSQQRNYHDEGISTKGTKHAEAHGLHSGIFFDLSAAERNGLRKAIDERNFNTAVKIGFDPTHIEATGVTVEQAKTGIRPI